MTAPPRVNWRTTRRERGDRSPHAARRTPYSNPS